MDSIRDNLILAKTKLTGTHYHDKLYYSCHQRMMAREAKTLNYLDMKSMLEPLPPMPAADDGSLAMAAVRLKTNTCSYKTSTPPRFSKCWPRETFRSRPRLV